MDKSYQGTQLVAVCPACGQNTQKYTHEHIVAPGQGLITRQGEQITAHQCRRCGLVYLNPYFNDDEARAYYENEMYRLDVGWDRGTPFNWRAHGREQVVYTANLAVWLDELEEQGKVGDFSARRAHVGADPNRPDAVARTFELLMTQGPRSVESVSDVYHWEPDYGAYGFIMCCQTIDHLRWPALALERVHSALEPGGYFYVDFLDLAQTLQLKRDHPSNFTRQSATWLLRDVGFSLVASREFPRHFGYLVRRAE